MSTVAGMPGTDIGPLLRELAPALRAVLDPRIELVVDIATDCPRVACGSDAVEALLLQALRQLLDILPGSGRIRLSAHAARLPDRCVVMALDAGSGQVRTHLLACAGTPRPAQAAARASFER